VKELQPKNSRIKPDVKQKFHRNIFGEELELKKFEFQTIKKRWFDKNNDTLIFASYSEGLDLFLEKNSFNSRKFFFTDYDIFYNSSAQTSYFGQAFSRLIARYACEEE
jgi:hypothetical protein